MINTDNAKRIGELVRTANNLANQTEAAWQLMSVLSIAPDDLTAAAEEAESKEIISFFRKVAGDAQGLLQRLGG